MGSSQELLKELQDSWVSALDKGLNCSPVPPVVTVFVPFSLPWLPEITQQYQELQEQTAVPSQHLETKVKSLEDELGMAPQCLPRASARGDGRYLPCTVSTAAAKGKAQPCSQCIPDLGRCWLERGCCDPMLHTVPILLCIGCLLCSRAQYPLPLSPHSTTTQVNLDLALAKMAKTSQHWKEVRMTIAMEHKEHLQEFSLKPLEIIAPWSS
ncbi:uncharacterized protein LOC133282053 [Pezoporus flaviventris]|uniref:uncharacterized protein LOC133282053 n=1 Tax=Pezoporus flaviventris TaxID=889875 RepID=UPI002AB07BA8|nr:uncharacterized protein LOC133282053 [Pezoporus flaviventris]